MHPGKALLFMAIGALATKDIGTDQQYSRLPMYKPTFTKTDYATNDGSPEKAFYVTETRYLAATHVVTLIGALTASDKKKLNSYSFVGNAGKTEWLGGKTPPASSSFDVVTSYVTVQPSAGAVTITNPKSANTQGCVDFCAYKPSSLRGLTDSLSGPASVKSFGGAAHTGVSKDGWNATAFATFKTRSTPPISATGHNFDSEKHATFSATAHPKKYPTAQIHRALYPRAVDDIVVATIDSARVSWTNDFHGLTAGTVASAGLHTSSAGPETTLASTSGVSLVLPTESPTNILPIYPWDLNAPIQLNETLGVISSTVPTSSIAASTNFGSFTSSSPSPSITLGAYPWNLNIPRNPKTGSSSLTFRTLSTLSNPVSTSSNTIISGSSCPSVTLAVYPWDLAVQPIATSPSTTLATHASSTTSTNNADLVSCSSVSPSFTATFDDLPHFDISSDPNDTDIPPITNPYRKLYWQQHFGYVPPPSDPFPPKSPPQLAVYRASSNNNTTSAATGPPEAGSQLPGEIGAGPCSSDSAYWIDAHSAWFGCADGSPDPCRVTVNGYRARASGVSISQAFDVAPCAELKDCALQLVQFASRMKCLSGLQILASVRGMPVDYYIDDLVLSWSDESCAVQRGRGSAEED